MKSVPYVAVAMRGGPCAAVALACLAVACGARSDLLLYAEPAADGGVDSAGDSAADARPHADVRQDVSPPPRDAGLDAPEDAGKDAPPDTGRDSPAPPPDAGEPAVVLYIPSAPDPAGSTWSWGGSDWAPVSVINRPSVRDQTAMASAGPSVVLFGGLDANNDYVADTWLFAAGAWQPTKPSSSPAPRGSHAMAPLGSKVVLFGGNTGSGSSMTLGDTWLWDGATWSEVTSTPSPSPRSLAAMAPLGDKVVLFGGTDASQGPLNDTWVFDGRAWTAVPTATPPPGAPVETMAALGAGMVVLFVPDFRRNTTDTWRFDGHTWEQDMTRGRTVPALYSFGVAEYQGLDLLYGGYVGSTGYAQDHTFTWTPGGWRDLGPAPGPGRGASGATPCLMAATSP